jgi:hypothetical protein
MMKTSWAHGSLVADEVGMHFALRSRLPNLQLQQQPAQRIEGQLEYFSQGVKRRTRRKYTFVTVVSMMNLVVAECVWVSVNVSANENGIGNGNENESERMEDESSDANY